MSGLKEHGGTTYPGSKLHGFSWGSAAVANCSTGRRCSSRGVVVGTEVLHLESLKH